MREINRTPERRRRLQCARSLIPRRERKTRCPVWNLARVRLWRSDHSSTMRCEGQRGLKSIAFGFKGIRRVDNRVSGYFPSVLDVKRGSIKSPTSGMKKPMLVMLRRRGYAHIILVNPNMRGRIRIRMTSGRSLTRRAFEKGIKLQEARLVAKLHAVNITRDSMFDSRRKNIKVRSREALFSVRLLMLMN